MEASMSDVATRLIEPFSYKPAIGFKVESMDVFEATCREAALLISLLTQEINGYKDALAQADGIIAALKGNQ